MENGIEGLHDRSRSPRQFWNRIPDSERECIVERALDEPALSCRDVAVKIIIDVFCLFVECGQSQVVESANEKASVDLDYRAESCSLSRKSWIG